MLARKLTYAAEYPQPKSTRFERQEVPQSVTPLAPRSG
jgi:hypothetical protein